MAQLVGIAVVLYGTCLKAEKVRGFKPYLVESKELTSGISGDIPDVWFDGGSPIFIKDHFSPLRKNARKKQKTRWRKKMKRMKRKKRMKRMKRKKRMRRKKRMKRIKRMKRKKREQMVQRKQKMNKGLTIEEAILCGFSSKNFDLGPNLEKGDKRKIDPIILGQLIEIMGQMEKSEPYDIARLILTQQQVIDGLSYAL